MDSLAGGARAWLYPEDPGRWFATYRENLLRYARLAREEKCDLFVVGTELTLLTGPRDWKAWRSLMRDVRAVYPGPLTYAANWHSAVHVGFWEELDYIGIDAYYPVIGGTDRRLLSLGWLPYEAELKVLSAVHGRPVLFTEFGAADPNAQAAYLESFLRAFAGKSYVAGFLHWAWDMDPAHAGPADKSMSVRGKPALGDLEALFRAYRGGPPRPGSSADAAAGRAAAVMAAVPQ
ncbi:MAG: hypothetical protein KGJ84_10285 [Elusimicrobia bacterium]|nr:hypothetical protein [Elusimicrobiota bacterium]